MTRRHTDGAPRPQNQAAHLELLEPERMSVVNHDTQVGSAVCQEQPLVGFQSMNQRSLYTRLQAELVCSCTGGALWRVAGGLWRVFSSERRTERFLFQ